MSLHVVNIDRCIAILYPLRYHALINVNSTDFSSAFMVYIIFVNHSTSVDLQMESFILVLWSRLSAGNIKKSDNLWILRSLRWHLALDSWYNCISCHHLFYFGNRNFNTSSIESIEEQQFNLIIQEQRDKTFFLMTLSQVAVYIPWIF